MLSHCDLLYGVKNASTGWGPGWRATSRCACGSCLVVGFTKASCVLRPKASWQLAGAGGREVSRPHRLGWGVWSLSGSCSSPLLGSKLGPPGCGWKPRLALQPWPAPGVGTPQANGGLPTCPAPDSLWTVAGPSDSSYPRSLARPSRKPLPQPVSVSGGLPPPA